MRLAAYGPFGDPYIEGVPNRASTVAGIPMSWLLLGGLVLAVVALKD